MFENIVVGEITEEQKLLFAIDLKDWETNEKHKTFFTNERFIPRILKEIGVVKSSSEIIKNRPDLVRTLDEPNFIDVKWGKRHIFILVSREVKQ